MTSKRDSVAYSYKVYNSKTFPWKVTIDYLGTKSNCYISIMCLIIANQCSSLTSIRLAVEANSQLLLKQ